MVSAVLDPHLAMVRDVGCCDSSPMRHARSHAAEYEHPIVASLEPGEHWRWCYVHAAFV